MTREEDIKKRVETNDVYYVYHGRSAGNAEQDLRYLLSSNEELQRQIDFLDSVLSCVKHESEEMCKQVEEYEEKVRNGYFDDTDAEEK